MHNTNAISSKLELRIYSYASGTPVLQPSFTAELVLKNVAKALWSKYHAANNSLKVKNPQSLQNGDTATGLLCQAVRIFAPVTVRSQSPIVYFDATAAMCEAIPAKLPPPEAEQTSYLAEPLWDLTSQNPWTNFASRWLGKIDGVVGWC
jgi:hypothetical protein